MYFPGPQGFPQMGPGMGGPGMGGPGFPGIMPNMNQLENRVSSLERQVRRLDARVNRLETPFPAPAPMPTPYGQQGQFQGTDTTEQQYPNPYQTSMQIM